MKWFRECKLPWHVRLLLLLALLLPASLVGWAAVGGGQELLEADSPVRFPTLTLLSVAILTALLLLFVAFRQACAENSMRQSRVLLEVIQRAQARFLAEASPGPVFDDLLSTLLELTRSEYGFIGEVFHKEDGTPYLKTHAITNIAWDDATRAFYEANAPRGMEFCNLKTLFGAVLTTEQTVIANDPAHDPRRGGIPPGHPPLRAFLGMPLSHHQQMVGMVGIANRPEGYDEDLVQQLEPFLITCGQLIAAHRTQRLREKAEGESRVAEALYQSLVETLPVSLFRKDLAGRFIYANERFCSELGCSLQQLLGRRDVDLYPEALAEAYRRDDEQVLRTGVSVNREEEHPVLREEKRLVQVLKVPVRDASGEIVGIQGIFWDVTDRKQVELRLRATSERLAALIRAAPVAVVEFDAEGNILLWNEGAEKTFGWTQQETLGRPYPVLPEGKRREFLSLLQRVLSGETVQNVERTRVRKDGSLVEVSIAAAPVEGIGGRPTVLSIMSDITARKRTENELQEHAGILEILNQMGRILSAELDLTRLVQAVSDAGTRLTGAQFGAFFYNVVDERGESYLLHTLSGVTREVFGALPMPRNTDLFHLTFAGKGVVRLDDVREDPRYGRNPPYHGIPEQHLPVVSYLGVPVVSRSGEVLGGLFFGHPAPGIFTERAERLVCGLAAQAAVALDNARLFQAAQRELVQRRRAEEALRTSLHEKEALLKEVHHRVKNNLQIVSSLLSLQADKIQEPGAMTLLSESQNRVRAMALVHETLYRSETLARTDLARYLQSLCDHLYRVYGIDPQRIRLDFQVDQASLDLDRAIPCGLIVNELVSNSLKYAFPDNRSGRISIRLEVHSDMSYILHIGDDGVGLPPGYEQGHPGSLGLHLVNLLTRQLRGSLAVERGPGVTFTITFQGEARQEQLCRPHAS